MSDGPAGVDSSGAMLTASGDGHSRRRRERHRKRRKPQIVTPSWRWWHVLAAIAVALVAGGISILLLRTEAP